MRSFVRLLATCAVLAVRIQAAELHLHAQWNHQGLVRFTTDTNHTVAGPEPIIRWGNSVPRLLRESSDSATLALTADGLTATVGKGSIGRFGDLVFSVEVRNGGNTSVTGALRPPFSQWADSVESSSASSPEFLLITATQADIGSLGVHRSWSPGAEFNADTFVTRPKKAQGTSLPFF